MVCETEKDEVGGELIFCWIFMLDLFDFSKLVKFLNLYKYFELYDSYKLTHAYDLLLVLEFGY